MNASELALLQHRLAVEDDQSAFIAIVDLFERQLRKFALSICHSKEDAEEIVEDVFVRIWLKRKNLDQINNLRLYLFLATRNNALNYLRAKKGVIKLNIEDMVANMEGNYQNPEEVLLSAEIMDKFAIAIGKLPIRCKIIFKLVKEDGLRQKEVAELLDISVKTVENQLAIAIKRLAKVAEGMDLPKGGHTGQNFGKIADLKNILLPLWGFGHFLVLMALHTTLYGQHFGIINRKKAFG